MTGTTISGHLNHGITLGAAGYGSPLTIASTGTVQPTGNGVTGIYAAIADGLIENNGTISGGAGNTSHTGGDGVFLSNNSTIINNNNIVGGALTAGSLFGGIGLYVTGNSTATNTGIIAGGAGIDLGGTGLLLDDSAATNTGLIIGGNGGTLVTGSSPATTFGGNGGAAVLMTNATLDNAGKILGGTAGANSDYKTLSYGGDGVSMSGGMLTNAGSITGGAPAMFADDTHPGTGIVDISGTVMNTGLITGGGVNNSNPGFGGTGLTQTYGLVINDDTIAGGYGFYAGGAGVTLSETTFTNYANVKGGQAGFTVNGEQFALHGGVGIIGANSTVINNNGGTIAGADTADGVILTNATLQNRGTIIGAASLTGGALVNAGIMQGSAILDDTNFTNTGTITGTSGILTVSIPSDNDNNVNGLSGVSATGIASLTNAGKIVGGMGQTSYDYNNYLPPSGNGGTGLTGGMSIITNAGEIYGGAGGAGLIGKASNPRADHPDGANGGNGGIGVSLSVSGTIINSGIITGGAGGKGGSGASGYYAPPPNMYDHYAGNGGNGGNGGTAVYMNGGTLINAGTIEAGAAGAGGAAGSKKATAGTAGTIGDAIVFGTTASTLIADAGAVFIGDIVADKSQHDVLELAGTSTTICSGIGQTVTGFSDFSFATGAERTIQGSALALANGESISGFAADDKIIINGVSATSIGVANGKIHLSNKQTTLALNLAGPGAQDVVINASAAGTTIASLPGPITLAAGYTELVTSTGTAAATNIAGGTLDLIAGASLSSGVTFSGTNGELIIGATTLPTQTITGFAAGDTIQLAGITYATGASAAVTTAGTVTITDAGKTYDLNIAGATVGETDFVFGPGADLTKTITQIATISTDITAAVSVESAMYAKQLLITSTGAVTALGDATAINIITAGAVITNNGGVYGNSTYATAGILLTAAGTVINSGTISAGQQYYGQSGTATSTTDVGIDLLAGGRVTNTGIIAGGNQVRYSAYYVQGFGGDGVAQAGGSLANAGKITGGAAEAAGGAGVSIANGVLSNTGTILGGSVVSYLVNETGPATGIGGFYFDLYKPLAGGTGAVLTGGTLINSGTIAGAYDSGVGASLTNTKLQNTGHITGGAGVYGQGEPKDGFTGNPGFAGGNGVDIAGTLAATNQGTIIAGNGGHGGNGYSYRDGVYLYGNGGTGGAGGDGVSLSSKTTFTNTGVVIGGAGGSGGQAYGKIIGYAGAGGIGGAGGAAVYLAGGTLLNSGTITGGAAGTGGASTEYGTGSSGAAGDAVQLGTLAATVVDDANGVFNGLVVANKSLADSLVLAGDAPNAVLSGIGTQFQNFNVIGFATGAERTASGNVAGLASGETIAGFVAHDKLIVTGFSETSVGFASSRIDLISAGTTIALNINGAGEHNLLINATSAGTTIAAPAGAVTVTAGFTELLSETGTASATTVHTGGTLAVYGAGSESVDATILKGGVEAVFNGATASATNIAGGTLNLNAGVTVDGGITFSGTGGELILGGTKLPTQIISGFVSGDTIELAGITYATGAKAMVTTAGTVTITDAGKTYNLDIAGATVGETDFVFSPGSLLTKTAAAKTMSFVRPAATAAATPVFTTAVTTTHQQTSIAANTIATTAAATDLLRGVPRNGIQTILLPHSS